MDTNDEYRRRIEDAWGDAWAAEIVAHTDVHPEVIDDERVCATCDALVDDDHPAEWMCSNAACGMWFHVGGTNRCPHCGSEPLR